MILIDIDLKEWCEKWQLEVEKYDCPSCGKSFDINVPARTAESAWLVSAEHECGPNMRGAIGRPATEDAKRFWETIV